MALFEKKSKGKDDKKDKKNMKSGKKASVEPSDDFKKKFLFKKK